MKPIILSLLSLLTFSLILNAQQQPTPQLLKQPAGWQFERFALPPQFAPNFPYKGAEELRFSPGMFIKDSTTYFTYAFVAELDDVRSISQSEIKNYLLQYFKGLCFSTARNRKLIIDTSKISVDINKKKSAANEVLYTATCNIFGVFTDGAPVKLNIEIKVLANTAASKVYLIFIASPHEKNDAVWKELYQVQKEFIMP